MTKSLELVPIMTLAFTYQIIFRTGDTTRTMVERGGYGYVSLGFLDRKNFRSPMCGRVCVEAIGYSDDVTFSEVDRSFETLGVKPARLEHLLAIGCQHPKVFSELEDIFSKTTSEARLKGISPRESDRIETMLDILERGTMTILAHQERIGTCVSDYELCPALSNDTKFCASGKSLFGYQVSEERKFKPGTFFLGMR